MLGLANTIWRHNITRCVLSQARFMAKANPPKPPTGTPPGKPPGGKPLAAKPGPKCVKSPKAADKAKAAAAAPCKKLSSIEALKVLQAKFQKDDGLPIHLKGGSSDQMLYKATWVLCILGLLLQVKLFLYYLLL